MSAACRVILWGGLSDHRVRIFEEEPGPVLHVVEYEDRTVVREPWPGCRQLLRLGRVHLYTYHKRLSYMGGPVKIYEYAGEDLCSRLFWDGPRPAETPLAETFRMMSAQVHRLREAFAS